jgi:hypothetical protein
MACLFISVGQPQPLGLGRGRHPVVCVTVLGRCIRRRAQERPTMAPPSPALKLRLLRTAIPILGDAGTGLQHHRGDGDRRLVGEGLQLSRGGPLVQNVAGIFRAT